MFSVARERNAWRHALVRDAAALVGCSGEHLEQQQQQRAAHTGKSLMVKNRILFCNQNNATLGFLTAALRVALHPGSTMLVCDAAGRAKDCTKESGIITFVDITQMCSKLNISAVGLAAACAMCLDKETDITPKAAIKYVVDKFARDATLDAAAAEIARFFAAVDVAETEKKNKKNKKPAAAAAANDDAAAAAAEQQQQQQEPLPEEEEEKQKKKKNNNKDDDAEAPAAALAGEDKAVVLSFSERCVKIMEEARPQPPPGAAAAAAADAAAHAEDDGGAPLVMTRATEVQIDETTSGVEHIVRALRKCDPQAGSIVLQHVKNSKPHHDSITLMEFVSGESAPGELAGVQQCLQMPEPAAVAAAGAAAEDQLKQQRAVRLHALGLWANGLLKSASGAQSHVTCTTATPTQLHNGPFNFFMGALGENGVASVDQAIEAGNPYALFRLMMSAIDRKRFREPEGSARYNELLAIERDAHKWCDPADKEQHIRNGAANKDVEFGLRHVILVEANKTKATRRQKPLYNVARAFALALTCGVAADDPTIVQKIRQAIESGRRDGAAAAAVAAARGGGAAAMAAADDDDDQQQQQQQMMLPDGGALGEDSDVAVVDRGGKDTDDDDGGARHENGSSGNIKSPPPRQPGLHGNTDVEQQRVDGQQSSADRRSAAELSWSCWRPRDGVGQQDDRDGARRDNGSSGNIDEDEEGLDFDEQEEEVDD